MNFKSHSHLEGQHAFLSPSQSSWVNYDDEKLTNTYLNRLAAAKGERYHRFAAEAIALRQKLPDTGQTLNSYVNDCIGWGLKPEVTLYYSEYAFGHADAIDIDIDQLILRCSDLKTGESPVKHRQLKVYSALACLEYGFKPFDLRYELRLYHMDDILFEEGDPDEIAHIMSTIVAHTKRLRKIRDGVVL